MKSKMNMKFQIKIRWNHWLVGLGWTREFKYAEYKFIWLSFGPLQLTWCFTEEELY